MEAQRESLDVARGVVGVVCQGAVICSFGVHLFGTDVGGLAFIGLRESIRAVFDQFIQATFGAFHQGPVQGCIAIVVCAVNTGPPFKKKIDTCRPAFVSGPHQAGVALGIWDVHGNVLLKK